MPPGSRHMLTGVLRSGQGCLELHVDGSGHWIIDPPSWGRAHRLIDRRVMVEGTRSGFNMLDANIIMFVEAEKSPRFNWRRMFDWVA